MNLGRRVITFEEIERNPNITEYLAEQIRIQCEPTNPEWFRNQSAYYINPETPLYTQLVLAGAKLY